MQVENTTCSQWPWRTQSSEFQAAGRVKVILISSWASLPLRKRESKLVFFHKSNWATITRIRTTRKWRRQQPVPWICPFEVIQDLHYQRRAKRKLKPNQMTKPQLLVSLISPAPRSGVIRLLSKMKTSLFISEFVPVQSTLLERKNHRFLTLLLPKTVFHVCLFRCLLLKLDVFM